MSSPYTPAKIAYTIRFIGSVLLMLFGASLFGSRSCMSLLGVVLAFWATGRAIANFTLLARTFEAERQLKTAGGAGLGSDVRGESIPQLIFRLLYTVAEVDGQAGPRERELVRQFLLSRFMDPRVVAQLLRWEAQPVPLDQLASLVHQLRARISPSESNSLFFWCCLIALIDERFHQDEHDVLQIVAQNLGISGHEARTIFLHAKSRVMAGGGQQSHGGGGGGGYRQEPRRPADRRADALRTLGLEAGASKDEIRKRHRELVKKHHPDAHSHLGPVAQQEATERFREIQAAYETLSGQG